MNVVPTRTPPGLSTREISARAAWALGQQWMAAPAWIAETEPVANGSRPTSARSSSHGVLVLWGNQTAQGWNQKPIRLRTGQSSKKQMCVEKTMRQ